MGERMGEREQHTQNPNSALPGVLICIPDSACAALRSMRSPVHGCSVPFMRRMMFTCHFVDPATGFLVVER